MIKVTLDNGREIITTPDHPYMLRTGEYCRADQLQINDSLMPLYFKKNKEGYEQVKLNSKPRTAFFSTYKIVAETLLQHQIEEAKKRSGEEQIAIHHKNFNKADNSPQNLYPMGVYEHYKFHYDHVLGSPAFDKFKAAGEEYRLKVMDRTSQEYKKQAKIASQAVSKY